ncbi:hypothetical protein B0H13DRAFT_2302571 [Mycena leptocephala]|nr:hypothetical protein B0H13DRAFT_2302571 [Mycena leptocephala]
MYRYPLGTILEYPETSKSPKHPIGHLSKMDPDDWQVPDLNIVYSRGAPTGRTLGGKEVFFDVMVDTSGQRVPCTESHSTCQGVKICPHADAEALSEPHTNASLANIQTGLRNDREDRLHKYGAAVVQTALAKENSFSDMILIIIPTSSRRLPIILTIQSE